MSVSYQSWRNLVSICGIYNEEFCLLDCDEPFESVLDVGILYGLITKSSGGFALVSLGLSFVSGVRRGNLISVEGGWFGKSYYEKLHFIAYGIPIETRLFWTPLPFLGIGIYGFTDLNFEKSFLRALLCLQIGKLG